MTVTVPVALLESLIDNSPLLTVTSISVSSAFDTLNEVWFLILSSAFEMISTLYSPAGKIPKLMLATPLDTLTSYVLFAAVTSYNPSSPALIFKVAFEV